MRQIGHLDNEPAARKFSDFLYVQGIENEIEPEKGMGWAIWIRAEDEVARAKELLASFRQNPQAAMFNRVAQSAAQRKAAEQKAAAAYEKKVKDAWQLLRVPAALGFGPLTILLIGASVAVFLWSKFGHDLKAIYSLFISQSGPGLPEVRSGELWRLFTPMFIHFNFLHLFFNMLWLWDLGNMIESRQSTWRLALLVGVISAGSNLAQYLLTGPLFGGMSGVVYGLIGYIWLRGKFDPASGLELHGTTVVMVIIWFFVCLAGLVGPVANVAHAVGLGMGMAWGYLSSLKYR